MFYMYEEKGNKTKYINGQMFYAFKNFYEEFCFLSFKMEIFDLTENTHSLRFQNIEGIFTSIVSYLQG